MTRFTKRDLLFSIATGLITGFIGWKILEFLKVPEFQSISCSVLIVLVPIAWILGVLLGYFLGRWFAFFMQFGKFAAIGFTNAAVDFGVLNMLIVLTGASTGLAYAPVKALAFLAAVIPSYFWNKFWAFNSRTGLAGFEFAKFLSVAVIDIFVNTAAASLVVLFIDQLFGTTAEQWANIGAAVGSGVALIFSFLGFKFAVFRR